MPIALKNDESISSLITFNCAMDFRTFPFDKQFCAINMFTPGYYKTDGMSKIPVASNVLKNFYFSQFGLGSLVNNLSELKSGTW